MPLFVDVAYESLYKYGEELCGDKVELVRGDGFTLCVLADGLGSGVKANILATLTGKIIATMLANGATLSDAVETIADTLPVCSERGIAYSTFTVIKVDRGGKTTIAEFDNPSMVYIREGKLVPIERIAATIGGKTIFQAELTCGDGDTLIAFSDGVVHAGVGSLLDLGWQYDNIVSYITENISGKLSPRTIARKLLSAVNGLYMGKCGDDSTVCALGIKRTTPLTVMVGPPLDKSSDEAVVQKLIRSDGIKVVCGGTTSQIVSKVTGAELNVSLNYENPAVPPTATMDGIDLVTEGVLTLGKALEIVKAQTGAEDENRWDTFSMNKQDGATRLAKLFIEDGTEVHFLVGRALNPSHQNPSMPISLGLKLNLIKELSTVIEKMGKRVTVEYF